MTGVALLTIWVVALINCATVATGGRTALFVTSPKWFWSPASESRRSCSLRATGRISRAPDCGGSCEGVSASARGGMAGFGAAMLGALWAYDGWNNVAPLAGEIRDPQRNLPRAFIGGMLVVVGAVPLRQCAYLLRADARWRSPACRIISSVATEVLQALPGPDAVSLTAVALMVSSFGSLHASVLANSRIPFAMARDGLFFRGLAKLSPRSKVPVRAISGAGRLGQRAGAVRLLRCADRLGDFRVVGLLWARIASLFIFRRTMPDATRPYRALGYPVVPMIFLLVTVALLVNTFVAAPRQALQGVAVLFAGLPFYWWWSRQSWPLLGAAALGFTAVRGGATSLVCRPCLPS